MGEDGLDQLATLDVEILAEVVREGEMMLDAQLNAALAADARAYNFAGLTVAGATAVIAAAAAYSEMTGSSTALVVAAAIIGAAMLIAAALAVLSARPARFFFPGNEPRNWLPENWADQAKRKTMKSARVEQAGCLQVSIEHNRQAIARSGRLMNAALIITFAAIAAAAAVAMTGIALR